MGKSRTIEQKMKDDARFREYVDQLSKNFKREEYHTEIEIAAFANKRYEDRGWKYSRLFGDKIEDYQCYSDWSFDKIDHIINIIGKALKDGNFPSEKVPGSESTNQSVIEETKIFLPHFSDDLIVPLIKTILSGMFVRFSVVDSITKKTAFSDVPLSGGMHLFCRASGQVVSNPEFFPDQFMMSFKIVFEAFMSVEDAQKTSLTELLRLTEKEIDKANGIRVSMRREQADSLMDILRNRGINYYKSTKAAYDEMLTTYRKNIDQLMTVFYRYTHVIDMVDAMYDRSSASGTGLKSTVNKAFDVNNADQKNLLLKSLFNEWEEQIAKRYISEKEAI